MGCFRVDVRFTNVADRARSASVPQLLVDTGREATWAPRKVLEQLGVQPVKKDQLFIRADGMVINRAVGYAIVEVAPDYKTVDEIVFADEGDSTRLGARSLAGLNVRTNPEGTRLVTAGPLLAPANIQIEQKRSN